MQIKCFSLAASYDQHQSSSRSSSATVITLVEVSIEYAEDCSGDISRHESCHTSKTAILGKLESSI